MQLVLALAAGVTVGAGLLVVFGVPDRRMGPAGVAAALRAGGVPVGQVTGPLAAAKGSRPFEASTGDGNGLFVKVFGSDQRDADLLYRAWRGIRLRGVGDTRPAASLVKAVEHEALLGVMAERAGVAVPHVGQVIRAGDGSVLLTMDLVAGSPWTRSRPIGSPISSRGACGARSAGCTRPGSRTGRCTAATS